LLKLISSNIAKGRVRTNKSLYRDREKRTRLEDFKEADCRIANILDVVAHGSRNIAWFEKLVTGVEGM